MLLILIFLTKEDLSKIQIYDYNLLTMYMVFSVVIIYKYLPCPTYKHTRSIYYS